MRKSHDKDCWTNAPESGFILKEGSAKRGKSQRGCSSAVSALFYPGAVSPCCAPMGAGQSHAAVCGRDERPS